MTRAPGDHFDRYVLEGLLGRGGMGEVWRARDRRLERLVALKILPAAASLEPSWARARARMLREARSAAALNHPNVVAVFDVGETDDEPYIAMELVEGVTLREYVGDARSARTRVQWLTEIARALAAAHDRGVIHRDVKPENVMVRHDGALKVLDFGISRRVGLGAEALGPLASSLTRDDELIGTLRYMAPEQLLAAGIDARTDQFAWGIVAWELLRGAHPWPKDEAIAIARAIVESDVPGLEPSEEVPATLAAIVARATAKRPGDRFPSMHELLDALEGPERLRGLPRAPRATDLPAGPSSLTRTLGTVIADRYELVRLLGRGGMGDVYEAIDGAGGARVALKMVRADRLGDTRAVQRFQREIELTRRIVHPGVARVIDASVHHTPGHPEPTLLFAMDLLRGETLAAYLARRGALPLAEAYPLAREMAAALGAAHAAGVVHRDFKSANVFLEPRAEGGLHVVVTDFGLARAIDADVSADGGLVGTPAYMAPEQVARGGAVDARADVHALGVVMFEMVTGRLPFAADTPVQAAMMRLHFPPPSPRSFVSTIDARWEEAILRCLAREPSARFATTGEVAAALEPRGARRWTRWAAGALAVATMSGAGYLAFARTPPRPRIGPSPVAAASASAAPEARVRPAVAVWSLFNATGDARAAWLDVGLGEMLRTELAAGEALRIVPGANSARAKSDLAIAASGDPAAADVVRAGTALGANVIVDGAYVVVGSDAGRQIRLDLHVKDAATGQTLASVTQAGSEDDLFDLVERSADSLRAAIHAPEPEAASVRSLRASSPVDGEAARELAEGVALAQHLDYGDARVHFERTIALDPRPPLPHAALADALFSLGYVGLAAAEAKAALDRAGGVGRAARLEIEAKYAACTNDAAGAADHWRALVALFPDNVEYGLALARAYKTAGDPAHALGAIAALRNLPAPERDDPRIDLAAAAATAQSNVGEARKLAELAVAKASARGERSVATEAAADVAKLRLRSGDANRALADDFSQLGRTFLDEGNRGRAIQAATSVGLVYRHLGDLPRARRELEGAVKMARSLGHPGLEAEAEEYLGNVTWSHGDSEASVAPHYQRALEIGRAIGDQYRETCALNDLGVMFMELGKYDESRPLLEAAAKVAAAIHSVPAETIALDDLALLLDAVGQMREALAIHQDMAGRFRRAGTGNDLRIAMDAEARDFIALGDLDAADALLDEAERTPGAKGHTERATRVRRAEVAALRGDLAKARSSLESAIEESRKVGGPADEASWSLELEEIEIASGTPRTTDLRASLAGNSDPSAESLANFAASLALDGKMAEAIVQARRAALQAPKEGDYTSRTRTLLAAANALARAGRASEALALAGPLADDAGKRGLLPWSLEARLVMARTSGAKDDAALAQIEGDARAHGLLDVARRAADLRPHDAD